MLLWGEVTEFENFKESIKVN